MQNLHKTPGFCAQTVARNSIVVFIGVALNFRTDSRMFWPVIRKIGGLILSKFRYYNAIRRKTKTVEVRLFEKMK
jgi:hypothetical protein